MSAQCVLCDGLGDFGPCDEHSGVYLRGPLEAQPATVTAERDALAAENARLRSAFAEMLPVATGALDDEGHVDVRRWRELEAAMAPKEGG